MPCGNPSLLFKFNYEANSKEPPPTFILFSSIHLPICFPIFHSQNEMEGNKRAELKNE